ncbi:MAG: phosphatidate cytidylyltransferase [Gammaproteobacteria bacterium]
MLKTRLLAAAVMIPAAILWVWLAPPLVFAAIAAVVVLAAAWEWAVLAGVKSGLTHGAWLVTILGLLILAWWGLRQTAWDVLPLLWVFLAFWVVMALDLVRGGVRNSRPGLLLQGVVVLVPAFFALLLIRGMAAGSGLIFALFAVVWGADAGAYFAGRAVGRHKLAPRLSPGKTWEGLIGGLVLAAVAGALASLWCPVPIQALVPLAVVTAAFSVVGDLVESRLKRASGAKDSGHLIPGHGGVLDRIDSLGAAAPVFALGLVWVHRLW